MAIKTFFINSTVATYNDDEFAWFQSLMLTEGVIGDPVTGTMGLAVIQNGTPDMSVLIGTGNALVELTKSGRTFKVVVKNDAQVQVTIPANVSGVNRVDAIIVRVDKDADPNISKTNISTIERVAGTGATALSNGAIDTAVGNDGWYRLADVTVTNGDTDIVTGQIADLRAKVAFSNGMAFSPIFISSSAGAGDSGKVGTLNAQGNYDQSFFKKPIVRQYTLTNIFGSSTTQFDITNPAGSTFRYTYDATGTDPVINATTVPIGTQLYVDGQNFAAGNKGAFTVTGSGVNYFEVTNASGVVESNKTLGTGSIKYCWIKPAGISHIKVQVQGGGGGSAGTNSGSQYSGGGGAGGYTEDIFVLSELVNSYEIITVGVAGAAGGVGGAGTAGGNSIFGTTPLLQANGGGGGAVGGGGGAGGTVPTAGYLAVAGEAGGTYISATTRFFPPSAKSFLSTPAQWVGYTCTDCNQYGAQGSGYGFGGAMCGIDSQPSGISGQAGGQGIIIITEYYV